MPSATPAFCPPRLHVLLARNANYAVILRRGPSKTTCAIGWDRRKDTFTVGQWVRARIYERRSDLSPDGKHLIYFAMNGRWTSKTGGSWTAVSRAPYLKAITLLGKGDCWHGGGLFRNDRRYWLNDGHGHKPLLQSPRVTRDADWSPKNDYGGECLHVYFNRLQRDGWAAADTTQPDCADWSFTKPINNGWVLWKHCGHGTRRGQGVYHDRHALVRAESDEVLNFPEWEWADLDRGRLVWSEGGRLHAAYIKSTGLKDVTLLHDFNDMTFAPIAAPY